MAIRRGWLRLFLAALFLLAGCGPAGGAARPGQMAPALLLRDLSGKEVRLSGYRGRPVVLHFWTTWCPSCRVELPELEKAHVAQGGKGAVILTVDLAFQDDRTEVERVVADLGLTLPILLDEDGDVSLVEYRVSTLPTSFFIDPDGRIHRVQVGPMTATFVERVLQEMAR